ncbi:hypothetical protein FRC11_008711, partial [Ceratobasidium sp. 423]
GPEILDDAAVTFGSDIWSWAMTSLEILTDEPPFGARTRGTRIIHLVGNNKRPERANYPKLDEYEHSDEIWQLFEDCWKRLPEERPSAREVVRRIRPLVREFGKKNGPNVQKPPEPTYPRTKDGPEQNELGKATRPVVQEQPPSFGGASGPGNQDGQVSKGQPRQGAVSPANLTEPTNSQGGVTFAQLFSKLSKSVEISLDFGDALQAFRLFLEVEESVTIGKAQLKVLRAQAVHVLEGCAWYKNEGGNVSQVLPEFTQALFEASEQIKSNARWDLFIKDSLATSRVEIVISEAFNKLAEQLRQLNRGQRADPLLYHTELDKAREVDREKVESIKFATKDRQYTGPEFRNLNKSIKPLVDHCLELMAAGNSTTRPGQRITDPKQTLAAIAELSGQSVPLITLVDEEFTGIINQSATYEVLVGNYITGQQVAIKRMRHFVGKETANRIRSDFFRLRENWTLLRHDCINPLYGLGIMDSRIHAKECRLYFVSPYLRNQDASTYLRMYPMTSESVRLQMVLDIARGLQYMHSEYILPDGKGVVHRALNVHNVLIKDSGRAVISGFGHADILDNISLELEGSDHDKYRYMGPESLDNTTSALTFGSDIWSWGMTSLQILTDKPPFGNVTRGVKIIQEILTRLPERASYPKIEDYKHKDKIWKLLEDCWKKVPKDRPSADDIVKRLKSLENKSINHHMSATEILRLLSENGYPDITSKINIHQCSSVSVNQGGSGDIYQGYLTNGSKVAIKCPRRFNTSEDEGREALKAG